MNFSTKSPRNLVKTQVKQLSKAYTRFSEGPDAINDVQNNILFVNTKRCHYCTYFPQNAQKRPHFESNESSE